MSNEDPPTLLDYVLQRLSTLPGARTFTASTLVSQPRKSPGSLFPYAPNIEHAELYTQEVIILVAEDVPVTMDAPSSTEATSTETKEAPAPPSTTTSNKPVYVSGLEAVLYIFPNTHSVIVYISKVDSTGQGKKPSPTRTMVLSFFDYVSKYWFGTYIPRGDVSDREEGGAMPSVSAWTIWIQLFARSQNQYLFPASIEHKGKRVLSDIGLVKWWKAVLDDATSSIMKLENNSQRIHSSTFVTIPGLSPAETAYTLQIPLVPIGASPWIIGNPYSTSTLTFPTGVRPPCSISQLIPWFPDDPKARLLDEIANTTTKSSAVVSSPPKKRRKLDEDDKKGVESSEKVVEEEEGREKEVDYVRTVSAEEFWERMDGRQECRLGTVAFFAAYIGGELIAPTTPETKPQTRASRPPKHAEVTVAMIRKIATALDNYDFGTTEKAARSTELLQNMIRSLTGGLVSVTARIPGHQIPTEKLEDGESVDGSVKDTLRQYITRSVQVDNPEWVKKVEPKTEEQPVVNVLTVRKKKRPNPA
jgi:regulator of Ty1 transposition protein 109